MKPKEISLIFMLISTACLAVGYAMAGRWLGIPFIVLGILAGWYNRTKSGALMPTLLLWGAACMAATGVILKAPSLLMLIGVSAALGAWDLALSEQPLSQASLEPQLQNRHLQSLAIALALGLLCAGIGAVIRLHMPFGLLVLLIALAFFALDRLARGLRSQEKRQ